jgi:protein TonB
MQTSSILSAQLIDIIFDGRNKDYGAYELRKKYNKRISRAMLITGVITFLALGTAVLAGSLKHKDSNYRFKDGVILREIEEQKKPEKLPEPDQPKPREPEVQTERFTEPEIVEQPETPPPSQPDLADSRLDVDPQRRKSGRWRGGPRASGPGQRQWDHRTKNYKR